MKQYLNLLLRLDQLIRSKGTGAPPDFARKMGISERSLYEYLKVLKELGAPIKFSRQDHSSSKKQKISPLIEMRGPFKPYPFRSSIEIEVLQELCPCCSNQT
jgi:hypothetical protein